VGTSIWFISLRQRRHFAKVWARQSLENQAEIQDKVNGDCAGSQDDSVPLRWLKFIYLQCSSLVADISKSANYGLQSSLPR
jgi:hypothetical protein